MTNSYAFTLRALLNHRILQTLTLLLFASFVFAGDGAKLFKQNCAVCHKMTSQKLTGPGLEGVMGRVPSEKWLFDWIKDNEKLRKGGDGYANKIFADYGSAAMTVFDGTLSDDDIKAVIEFIKNPPKETTVAKGPETTSGGGENHGDDSSLNWTLILIGVILFLIFLIGVLRNVRQNLKKVLSEKEGSSAEEDQGFWGTTLQWMKAHKTWVAVIILAIFGYLLKESWYGLKDLGVYQGYKPEQPIKFSHKVHAGDNAINCQYCHFTVEKSRHAGIPPITICMNCHKGIDNGPTTGTTEIAKIYEAAGWDPDKQAYTKEQKPVKWIKVHNLQDFVFFSHQQHVKVGKLDCSNCHGEVKEMTVAQQVQPLTMGWCIDCHRKTEVAGMKDNPYYEDLHKKLAEKYKGQKLSITVDKIGGIECAKCHY